eukprot:TRINITY_DN1971_c0_g1_i2.p1 TRINITY_DN1971_c0_g1~~TRINITY_DN1971_c0_g1_i2.p1  ORF type:complete len:216 (-),score=51.16 TRINITY_DN1971_c0_g1_i2:243-857(-)
MSSSSTLTILSIAILLSMAVSCTALSFSVDAHQEECFFEDVDAGTKLGLSFQVTTGGFLDIDVKIIGPDQKLVYTGTRETEGQYTFVSHMKGIYSFCFSNKMSTLTPKTVSFNVRVGETSSHDVLTQDHVNPVQESVMQLSDGLASIQAEQKYMHARESVHRNTTESTNTRILWWSFFEAVVLIAISLGQIIYLRRILENKSVV